MAAADRKARNRRTVDLMFGAFAEISIFGAARVFSWDGSTARQAPFGPAASVGALTAAFVLVAAAMVARAGATRMSPGIVLAALVAVWAVVACLGVMAFMTLAAGQVILWFQLAWSAGSAAVLGVGLANVRDQERRERAGREAA